MSGDFGRHFVPPDKQHKAGESRKAKDTHFDDAYTSLPSAVKKKSKGKKEEVEQHVAPAIEPTVQPGYSNHDRPEDNGGQDLAAHNVE